MMYVTEIYNDKGHPVGKVSKCDHGSKWLIWTWHEAVVGVAVALVVASQMFM